MAIHDENSQAMNPNSVQREQSSGIVNGTEDRNVGCEVSAGDLTRPPTPPDADFEDVRYELEPQPFHFSGHATVTRCKDGRRVFKAVIDLRELRLMRAAGDCAVKVLQTVFRRTADGAVYQHGIIMPLETPLAFKTVRISDKKAIVDQMISVVNELHEAHKIVHGDIKADNMLICSDGRLRLTDFAEAREVGEDPSLWNGQTTANYEAPNRISHEAPTIVDDLYALGLAIWSLYAGMHPFEDWYIDDIDDARARGETVNVSVISDAEVRRTVTKYLRMGGARI